MWKRTKIVRKINWHEKLNMLKSESNLKTRKNADGRRDTCPQTAASIFDASYAPGCSRPSHGHTPLQSERLQNRKADHEWPKSLQWLFSEKRILELHFKTNLCGLSDHRRLTANGLNIVEFSLDLATWNAALSDSFCFYGPLRRTVLEISAVPRGCYNKSIHFFS